MMITDLKTKTSETSWLLMIEIKNKEQEIDLTALMTTLQMLKKEI
jgi:hypothetical protein